MAVRPRGTGGRAVSEARGRMSLKSPPERPFVDITAPMQAPEPARAAPVCRVLLIDDEPAILRIYSRALANYGFESQCVSEPKLALELLEQVAFNVVVSDVCMPGGDGVDLVRSNPRAVPSPPGHPGLRQADRLRQDPRHHRGRHPVPRQARDADRAPVRHRVRRTGGARRKVGVALDLAVFVALREKCA